MASEPPGRDRAGWPVLAAGFGGPVPPPRARPRFARALAVRAAALALAVAALAWSLAVPGLAAVRLVSLALVCGTAVALWRLIDRTNRELARFVEAIAAGDLSQGFAGGHGGAGFDALAGSMDAAMRRLRDERGRLVEEARFAFALVEEAPTALLTVDAAGRVELVNKAARALFGALDGVDRRAFAGHGEAFVAALDPARDPVARATLPLVVGGMPQRAVLATAALSRTGAGLRLVAVEPIQRELAAAEVAAETDLVRVLTHEIMNSLTPVTSLARTAALLMEAATPGDLADARDAVAVLARRADGLIGFVDSYRQFARVPEVRRRRFAAGPWAEGLARLHAAGHGAGVPLAIELDDPAVTLDADPDLLAQALINLLKNAAEAAREGGDAPAVTLGIADGGRIAVADNGPGFAPGLLGDAFLPFFTTKAAGTGVGLSVARQIVVAHGGTIRAENGEGGGALLRIAL